MICPFLCSYQQFKDGSHGVMEEECRKDNCQLWITDLGTNLYGNCAISQIARMSQLDHDTPA